jgi:pimeloyl-ACP methyl ester carboxylesterase
MRQTKEIIMGSVDQQLVLQDGRRLGYAEYGEATGLPVFFFHGSAGSRLDRPSSENALSQIPVRFVSTDRPGHGLSDFQPRRRLVDWPQDIAQLADHLEIEKFYVMGHSAGGPHALACAHQLPERVIAGAAVSSIAPMSRPKPYVGMPIMNQILARSSRRIPWITMLFRGLMRGMMMGDVVKATRQLMATIPDSDKDILYDPKNVEFMVVSIREGFRTGHQGVALDDILVNGEWGFDLSEVKPRIHVWHGEEDVNVPIHAGRFLADHLPNSRRHFLPDKGHFFFLSHWGELLSALVNS